MRELRLQACSLKSQGAAEHRGGTLQWVPRGTRNGIQPPLQSLWLPKSAGGGGRDCRRPGHLQKHEVCSIKKSSKAGCHGQKSLVPGHSQRNLFGFYSS